MKIIEFETKEELSAYAGELLFDLLKVKKDAILGLATGSSPLGFYDYVSSTYKEKGISFKDVKSFNLDEYVNCPIEKETYRYFMNDNLFSKIDIDLSNTHFPSETNPSSYDEEIEKAGGVDFQLLGIGRNGHIGFNEPYTPFDSKTHLIELTSSTREANARFFNNDINMVPTHAVSMGIGTILKAKTVVLIANDPTKKEAILGLKTGKEDISNPATSLVNHPNCYILITKSVLE